MGKTGRKTLSCSLFVTRKTPTSGDGISPLGQERAEAYKNYFIKFTVDSKRLEPDVIFAAKDSKQSHRPRLTVEPFAEAAKLRIDTRFGNDQSADLAADLRANQQGKVILICWRHGEIPACFVRFEQNPKPFAEWQMARCGLQLGHPA